MDVEPDEGEEEVLPTPLAQRIEWADLTPLVVDEGAGNVVAIQYEHDHREALGYFRRIMDKEEYSDRALQLTALLISFNQADYTAWEWRWRCLRAMQVDLNTEYEFTDSIMQDNAKNYQLWNHRRKCALALGQPAAARELEVAEEALGADAKNYHAWAHRQAIVKEFGGPLWESELVYLERHITQDLRNNSAWNQRAFVVQHLLRLQQAGGADAEETLEEAEAQSLPPGGVSPLLRRTVSRELEFIAGQIARAPRNESAWNYLGGLFTLEGMPPHAMGMFEEVAVICREALLDAPSSPCALDMFASYYLHLATLAQHYLRQQQHLQHLQQQQQQGAPPPDSDPAAAAAAAAAAVPPSAACVAGQQAVEAAVGCCMMLLEALTVADPIRVMYWRHRQQAAQALLTAAVPHAAGHA